MKIICNKLGLLILTILCTSLSIASDKKVAENFEKKAAKSAILLNLNNGLDRIFSSDGKEPQYIFDSLNHSILASSCKFLDVEKVKRAFNSAHKKVFIYASQFYLEKVGNRIDGILFCTVDKTTLPNLSVIINHHGEVTIGEYGQNVKSLTLIHGKGHGVSIVWENI